MSEPNVPPAADTGSEAKQERPQAQLNILGQYIKDMSFENPNAAKVLQNPVANARLEYHINVGANNLKDNDFEVDLDIKVSAKTDELTLYDFEVVYSGVFRLTNIPQSSVGPVLFVTCPAMLFPFVRRLAADTIREGGFPSPMLDPIDFASLYKEQSKAGNGGPAL
jgi:preprotein translocase subunit SecB